MMRDMLLFRPSVFLLCGTVLPLLLLGCAVEAFVVPSTHTDQQQARFSLRSPSLSMGLNNADTGGLSTSEAVNNPNQISNNYGRVSTQPRQPQQPWQPQQTQPIQPTNPTQPTQQTQQPWQPQQTQQPWQQQQQQQQMMQQQTLFPVSTAARTTQFSEPMANPNRYNNGGYPPNANNGNYYQGRRSGNSYNNRMSYYGEPGGDNYNANNDNYQGRRGPNRYPGGNGYYSSSYNNNYNNYNQQGQNNYESYNNNYNDNNFNQQYQQGSELTKELERRVAQLEQLNDLNGRSYGVLAGQRNRPGNNNGGPSSSENDRMPVKDNDPDSMEQRIAQLERLLDEGGYMNKNQRAPSNNNNNGQTTTTNNNNNNNNQPTLEDRVANLENGRRGYRRGYRYPYYGGYHRRWYDSPYGYYGGYYGGWGGYYGGYGGYGGWGGYYGGYGGYGGYYPWGSWWY